VGADGVAKSVRFLGSAAGRGWSLRSFETRLEQFKQYVGRKKAQKTQK
jgi:hypothetical protein